MKEMKKRNQKMLLVLLLLAISLGYALLNATLTINGSSKIQGQSWDIHWNNVQVTTGSVSIGTNDSAATITPGDTTEVTYEVTLAKPGDFYEFTVDAVNGGTIDAMIDVITSTYKIGNGTPTAITGNNLPAYLAYSATYSDGQSIAQNHKLEANSTETYKVRIEFKKDIDANQLPSTAQTLTFNFAVNYKQADSDAIPVPHPVNGTRYTANVYDSDETDNNLVRLNQTMPTQITFHENPTSAMAELKQETGGTTDRPFFLKHTITNNLVTVSYVGFVVTDAMTNDNDGMTAGTYYLRGGVDESSLSDKPIFEANKAVLLSAFGSSNCLESSSDFWCNVTGFGTYVGSSGYVTASDRYDNWNCIVDELGRSGCYDNWP